jgi:hypothetical protein
MKRLGGACLGVILFSCALSCSGGSTGTTSGGTSGSSGSSGSSGASGNVPSGSGLTGTWDLLSTSKGQSQGTGSLAISATSFDLTLGSTRLTYTVAGDSATMIWQERSQTDNLTVQRTGAPFNTGALPLSLGGSWTVTESTAPGSQCAGTVGTDSLVHCEDVDLPNVIPNPRDGQAYQGKRTQAGTSVFGDLGGEWTFTAAGNAEGCKATFAGSTVLLQCDHVSHLDGNLNLTFNSDLTSVSGSTDRGVELSAKKR